jgi:hypothetical protein
MKIVLHHDVSVFDALKENPILFFTCSESLLFLYDLSYFSVFVYLLYLFCVILQLAYLPDRKRDFTDDDDISLDSELSLEGKLDLNNPDESVRFDRRYRKRGMLGWFLKVLLYGH